MSALHLAIFHGSRTLDADIHLVPIVHGPNDVTVPRGSVAVDFLEGGSVILLGLGAGDFHRLGPCTFVFGDRQRMIGPVSYFHSMFFIGLAAFARSCTFGLGWR